MNRKPLTLISGVVVLLLLWSARTSAADLRQQGVNVFFGPPFLVLGILAGLIAVAFAFYSAAQMKGGRIARVLVLIGTSILLLDIGVIAVTFFTVDATTKLIHDLGLLGGFAVVLIAFGEMRRIVG